MSKTLVEYNQWHPEKADLGAIWLKTLNSCLSLRIEKGATENHMSTAKSMLRESPLTDPRSVVISLLFNGALLLAASFMALTIVIPHDETPTPRVLKGEFESTDNRAPYQAGGGAPGELGGEGMQLSSDRTNPVAHTRDAAADALLSEILPTKPQKKLSARALPGPSTSGLGLVPGKGAGGGGGEGTGTGGGKGAGLGLGTEFFGLRDRAGSYAYVIDCSGSMILAIGKSGRIILDVAKTELLASLDQLSPEVMFGVTFYNQNARVLTDPLGRSDLMRASASNKARVRTQLEQVTPYGGTDHMLAFRTALAMKPEVIFFLTDADFFGRYDAELIRREAGKTRILAVEFGIGGAARSSAPLRWLAEATGGSYKYIDTRFLEEQAR